MKKKFKIEGMSCAACQAHVNKAVSKLNVNEVNVSLLTNSMEVDFDPTLVSEKDGNKILRKMLIANHVATFSCVMVRSDALKKCNFEAPFKYTY